MKHTILIVDDEPNAREYLQDLVAPIGNVSLCGICKSGNEAIQFCTNLQPDIVLLDIQMPGLNGIDTAKKLMEKQLTSVIIFTTAYDQFAIDAFEVEAIGYLLKPFSKAQFNKHLERAQSLIETKKKAAFKDRIQQLFERFSKDSQTSMTEISIHDKGIPIVIPIQHVLYIESDSEYAFIHLKKKKYIKRLSLNLLAKQLPTYYLRIHRSFIINTRQISHWKYMNNNTFEFSFENDVKLASSRSYKHEIETALKTIC